MHITYYVSPMYTEVGTYCFTPVCLICLSLSLCATWSPIHFSPALSILGIVLGYRVVFVDTLNVVQGQH